VRIFGKQEQRSSFLYQNVEDGVIRESGGKFQAPEGKIDALKIIREGAPLELVELFIKLGTYICLDTNADEARFEAENGFAMDVKFTKPEDPRWPKSDDSEPRYDPTIYDDCKAAGVDIQYKGGVPPHHEEEPE